MMKVVQINATCGIGSTGKICVGISKAMRSNQIDNYILYSSETDGDPLGISCSSKGYIKFQALKSRILGNYGFNSKKATQRMINELERIQPDIVHLHNVHDHDCNLEMLFSYFKRNQTKLIWTFHDCWVFTGYCPHFSMAKCNKWKISCSRCVQKRNYSWLFDRSKELFEKKRQLFSGLDLTIVTPSHWLADMVKESFLKEYSIQVINNGIDLEVFKPSVNGFRGKKNLEHKKIVLGVSFGWSKRKGFDVFVDLAQTLPEEYQIVLVGTDANTDKLLSERVLSVHKTQDQRELAEIYSAADILVNPTREEVLGLVNIEALACGTPGVTFNSGGSPECYDKTCGSVVECEDINALEKEIIRICTDKPFSEEQCVNRARKFDKDEKFKEYVKLYERVIAAGIERDRT